MIMCIHCGLKPKVRGRYCSSKCYLDANPEMRKKNNELNKIYHQRPEIKERHKQAMREYYHRPEIKEKLQKYQKEYYQRRKQIPEVKERMNEYSKEYHRRPEVKKRRKELDQEKKKLTTKNIKRVCNLRRGILKDFGFNNLAEEVKQEFTKIHNEVKEERVEIND